ncbi:hypothetical protein [Halobacteriovorax sp. HLS]|uniref:hypothetical protein n=1 Tax=Halobacteriovorax sp. HLS TaxID=2234000 RepID=UPI000FDAD43A|nr:hypothetical protein [Halobacteriovorax sp. HLS]
MENESVRKFTYFQYFKGMGLPVYIKVNLSSFSSELVDFLKSLKFDEMGSSEVDDLIESFDTDKFAKLLTLEEATPGIMRQIGDYSESDRFGAESIYPKENYSVYRFKGLALMLYGHSFKEWQMGCSDGFGSERFHLNSKIIIQRYLSWALAPLGILGVWGVPVEEGMVTMKPRRSEGEVVFIDIFKRWIYTQDGHKKLKSNFKFLKLDSSLKDRSIKMKTDHLIPMLTEHCTYFGYGGLSVATRQMIQNVSRNYEGYIYPVESFQPRTDLSL